MKVGNVAMLAAARVAVPAVWNRTADPAYSAAFREDVRDAAEVCRRATSGAMFRAHATARRMPESPLMGLLPRILREV